ncbi:hypothetical protein AJ78_07823 [Emergomyces pasteurianus Ep9510]|uniref:LIM zinc-binding domain-containing protein n=1 Tax=Emergomyces pasteurianus Ep9510 TaxID=1447872 RepID=A0A1J9P3U6_9EURO|nr:hypothetical protein AJ78_07823 [Emergomyces pasteurianus Ep9510]
MLHSSRAKNGRKVSPPGPSYMNEEQIATYLKDLRTNRPPRPNGSRPLPTKSVSSSQRLGAGIPPRASSALSMNTDSGSHHVPSADPYQRSISALSHHRTDSGLSSGSASVDQWTDEEPEQAYDLSRTLSPTASVRSTTGTYRVRGQRWMEREEARSLRQALEEMDLLDDEKRLRAAAQEEATQLVMSHQTSGFPKLNPHAAYRNPDLRGSNRFRQHLEKGAHSRSQSLNTSEEQKRGASWSGSHRSASDSSSNGNRTGRESPEFQRRVDPPGSHVIPPKIIEVPEDNETISVAKNGTLRQKPKVNFALPPEDSYSPETVVQRKASPRTRIASNDSVKGIFRNPEDQIYEEPQEDGPPTHADIKHVAPPSSALKVKPRNSLPRGARPFPGRPNIVPEGKKSSMFDMHRNPPSQSRNPFYKANPSPSPPSTSNIKVDGTPPTKDGREIRGDDIRAATSMRLKDRSTKLPMPTAVSDRPDRPIVSFDRSWRDEMQSNSLRNSQRNSVGSSSMKEITVEVTPPRSMAVTPNINVSDEPQAPVINVCDDSGAPASSASSAAPTISDMKAAEQRARPLPNPGSNPNKKRNSRNSGDSSTTRWYTPYTRAGVPTASCTACGLPISGRIVTACESRFHPECFACHHCQTPLECVAFYQEPEAKRAERLAEEDPNDEEASAQRFYCHLDFHELFSPRCKSCKTPIEGEVVIACGAEWHVGHFFCAECGDPFTSTTPFVEKAGHAWCVRCHSKRTASRCQGCKQPVLDDLVVTALGGQWHEKCFVCSECSGSFGPEGRFFVREGEQKFTRKGRPIIGPTETAVCEACEGRRLKA